MYLFKETAAFRVPHEVGSFIKHFNVTNKIN